MQLILDHNELQRLGLSSKEAVHFNKEISSCIQGALDAKDAWMSIIDQQFLLRFSFPIQLLVFKSLFPKWHNEPETAPAWLPNTDIVKSANISKAMHELLFSDVSHFHQWTVQHYKDFWRFVVQKLNIVFDKQPVEICNLENGVSPSWFPGSQLNIAESCFTANPSCPALIYEDKNKNICKLTFGELNQLSNQIANSLLQHGAKCGDAIAIIMPMHVYAIAIYLAVIKMGGVVVSIADSFSSEEIATRLTIAQTKFVFIQDVVHWGGKVLPLYEKIKGASAPSAIVLLDPSFAETKLDLREIDILWDHFLLGTNQFTAVTVSPMTTCNILFSSGTTGTPKAIPWNHTTAIKVASDAFFHQNIQAGDILAWPTNLGWMMGPWLIFAAFINQAAIALYSDAPKDENFGQFIEKANVTMLGVVPTLVAHWRQTRCMEKVNWRAIKVFSSSGECSNPEDMLYLMSLAGYKPIIEYCGGTEIGGAYVSSTVVQANFPSLFSTATMGLNFAIINDEGKPSLSGEVAIIPPSIGLSTKLLNADHDEIYFANMPKLPNGKILRRHGDEIKQLSNGYFCVLGRADDTMNLGGIKTSAAEIERALGHFSDIREVAAIAIAPLHHGPSQLIIYAATNEQEKINKPDLLNEMQKRINKHLNPLFKIHDLVFMNELPKTASNKIMRRLLRKNYQTSQNSFK